MITQNSDADSEICCRADVDLTMNVDAHKSNKQMQIFPTLSAFSESAPSHTTPALPLPKTSIKVPVQSSPSSNPLLPQHAIAATTFMVSIRDQPTLAPIAVALSDCSTLERFFTTLEQEFETLIAIFDLKGKPTANNLSAVLATYPWDQKRQLIRRGKWELKLPLPSQGALKVTATIRS